MPERKYRSTVRVSCDPVQGDDSYVELRRITVAEAKEFWNKPASGKILVKRVADHIIEWNWVDDDGDPLPQPKDDPAVIDLLSDREIEFLMEAFREPNPEAEERRKN